MESVHIGIHVQADAAALQLTLACLRAHTSLPYELVVLADGAEPDVRAVLAGMDGIAQFNTDEPRGAPACFNRLAGESRADLLVLLENGSLVAPGWLDHLLAALASDPRNGLAGPSTNRSWNEQRVIAGPRAAEINSIDDVAGIGAELERRFGRACRTLEPLYSLADFCYAVRRRVLDAIGPADEEYGLGPCWEMDFNIRAARAGFRGVWACASYVHRLPLSRRRAEAEARLFEPCKRRYQEKFCRRRLRGEAAAYCHHCRGDDCPDFAPGPQPAPAPSPPVLAVRPTQREPLASCIMVTRDRRAFVQRAISYFERQDYPNRELIIVDDGVDRVADLAPSGTRIRYLALDERCSVGAKRNRACQEARGEIIVHWDDDDWISPHRLSFQVAELLRHGADVCGLSRLYFLNPATGQAWLYVYGGSRPWAAGGTLCYTRRFWQQNSFADVNVGEDTRFVWSARPMKLVAHEDCSFYVATVHPGNTCAKRTGDAQWRPRPLAEVRSLIGGDWPFSHPLPPGHAPRVSCIMPTADRRPFVGRAVRLFLGQDYPDAELVIVDDGADAVRDLVPADPRVRYIRCPKPERLGAKRNCAVEAATGAFIAHWDDDDWYSPGRLRAQMGPILAEQADVVGLTMRYVLALPERQFWRCRPELHARLHYRDLCCGTIAYPRDVWKRFGPYPEVACCEDVLFLRRAAPARLGTLPDEDLFVCLRHGRNTWNMPLDWRRSPAGWEAVAPPAFFPAGEYGFPTAE